MIFKFTWPDHPGVGDVYVETPYINLTPNTVGDILVLMQDGTRAQLGSDGMRVYMLDRDGNTIDKPKVGGAV